MYDPTLPEPLPTFPAFPQMLECGLCWRHWKKLNEKRTRDVELMGERIETAIASGMRCVERAVMFRDRGPDSISNGFVGGARTTRSMSGPSTQNNTSNSSLQSSSVAVSGVGGSGGNSPANTIGLCNGCNHPLSEHLPADQVPYRESQINRAIRCHSLGNYIDMRKAVFGIARVAPGELRSQERNLLSSAHNLYISHLLNRPPMELNKREIVQSCMELLRVINEKILPRTFFHSLVVWLKLKLKCYDLIAQYGNLELKTTIQHDHESVKVIITDLKTHQELIPMSSSSPILLQLAVSYCHYLFSEKRPLRSYWMGTQALQILEGWDEKSKFEDQLELFGKLEDLMHQISESRIVHRTNPDKIIKAGYLKKRIQDDSESDKIQLSMPLWLVYGCWIDSRFIFVYNDVETKEASDVIVIPMGVTTSEVGLDGHNPHHGFVINNVASDQSTWYAVTSDAQLEWCTALEEHSDVL
eukprot:TRINITY_DN7056_c0_g1_i1.p1 TRINITY_DN7056_c0_g1~~TRINITY_DN7056_c0_g1_i1.p1  ORF type:complete len:547 (-),score=102.31 TRINITY_DN7056_c0_g1_i1:14-1426(-)